MAEELPPTLQPEELYADQRGRWGWGEPVRVEFYLQHYPRLESDAECVLQLINNEVVLREEHEGPARLEEYLERFRRLRTQLAELFEVHRALESGGPVGTGSAEASTVLGSGGPASATVWPVLPGYAIQAELGRGGMGVVFRAEQQQPVRRLVALKVIKAGMDTERVVARFEAERQALALMDHPNIAKVHDGGTTPSGRPYFVMELVQGTPITTYCDEQRLTLRQRLELFVPVCQAIQHAHQKGIIHRDIKPSNVLVASYDGKPVPEVIDFGVAKAIGGKLTEQTLFTGFGALVGTLEYMSPEQADINAQDIDTRSDIYSLGVLLYELLTGTTPLMRQRVKDASIQEVLRMIREEEPPRPSTRLSETKESLTSVSEQRSTEPAALVKSLRGEVDWIVMKCLEKDRTRRYETANGLARDIQRYLAEEPVEAGPPSRTYRLRKLAWKHRRGLAMAAALVLLLVAGSVVSTWQAVRATKAESRALTAAEAERQANAVAQTRLDQIEKANAVLTSIFHDLDPKAEEKGGPNLRQQLSQHLERAAAQLDETSVGDPVTVARLQHALGNSLANLGQLKLAIEVLEKVEKTLASTLGAEHPQTLISRNDLAEAYWSAGRTAEAIRLHEQNLQQREAKLGPDHPDTLASRNNLAAAYVDAGRTADAIRLHQQNLLHSEAKLGPDHPDTLTFRTNLAETYRLAGRTAEAIRLLEQTLKQKESKLGPDHPDTLASRNNLAATYFDAGRTADALRLHQQNSLQSEAKLGPDHPDTLKSNTVHDSRKSQPPDTLRLPNTKGQENCDHDATG